MSRCCRDVSALLVFNTLCTKDAYKQIFVFNMLVSSKKAYRNFKLET